MKFSKAEVEAIINASPRTFVPYNQLVLSVTYQARTNTPAPGGKPRLSIPELAASIQEFGVLQNLIVVEGPRNTKEVCAGGRRLEAIGLLVAAGVLPENYPVPVLIVPAERALMASLAENTFHVPMHPADEFVAFAKLIGEGRSTEDVAAAFGVTPLVVKRRMKLAAVSPKLLAQYRQEKIDLECLMVLASVDDHERQEQAWAGASNSWQRTPDHLRRVLVQGEVESNRCPVAKYVTVKAYENAGGPTRRDLFSDDEKQVFLLDPMLLDQLAVTKLQRKANQVLREGWKWVDVRARYVDDEYSKHGELRRVRRQPSDEEAAELDSLEGQVALRSQRMEELNELDDDDPALTKEYLDLEAESTDLNAKIHAITANLSVWPPELMAQAGCVVYVGHNAAPAVHHGLIRPDDRAEMAQLAQASRDDDDDSDDDRSSLVSLPSPKTRPVHSDKLVRNLTAHRVAAIQAELLARPDVAVAMVTAQLAVKLLLRSYRVYSGADAITLSVTDAHAALPSEAEDIKAFEAWQALEAEREHWQALVPQRVEAVLPWVLSLDTTAISRLFTFLTALTVQGVYGTEPQQQRADGLALALGLDMSNWWKPTAAAYFNHVSKARIVEVVTEAVGAQAAAPLQSLKKDAAAQGAEQAMATTGWLPTVLRLRDPASQPQTDAGASEHEDDDGSDLQGTDHQGLPDTEGTASHADATGLEQDGGDGCGGSAGERERSEADEGGTVADPQAEEPLAQAA